LKYADHDRLLLASLLLSMASRCQLDTCLLCNGVTWRLLGGGVLDFWGTFHPPTLLVLVWVLAFETRPCMWSNSLTLLASPAFLFNHIESGRRHGIIVITINNRNVTIFARQSDVDVLPILTQLLFLVCLHF
jgi:hypothetical protein